MTDHRITAAREFLQHARKTRRVWETAPPAEVVREAAELRRQLGQVLDAYDGSLTAPGGWQLVMLQLLRDGIQYRQIQEGKRQAGQIGLYRSLAAELGIDIEATP